MKFSVAFFRDTVAIASLVGKNVLSGVAVIDFSSNIDNVSPFKASHLGVRWNRCRIPEMAPIQI